jgi:hypothetical protein
MCRIVYSPASIFAAILATLAATFACGDEVAGFDPVKEIAAADSPPKLNRVYSRLFLKADWKAIDELKRHDHDGIALQAAWEEVRRSIPLEEPKRNGKKVPRLDAKKVQRFVGFVEGRLKVLPPPWWEDLLARARAERSIKGGELLTADTQRYAYLYQENPVGPKERSTVMAPFEVGIGDYQSGKSLVVSLNNKSLKVPVENLPWGVNAWPIGKNRYVAALYSAMSPYHKIICIDAEDQSVIWKSRVWGEFSNKSRQGVALPHLVDARLSGDRLLIFGVTGDVIYLEGFSVSEGKNLFRFSSTYPAEIEEGKK